MLAYEQPYLVEPEELSVREARRMGSTSKGASAEMTSEEPRKLGGHAEAQAPRLERRANVVTNAGQETLPGFGPLSREFRRVLNVVDSQGLGRRFRHLLSRSQVPRVKGDVGA